MRVKWVETGDTDYPRIPTRISNEQLMELASSKDFEMDTLSLLRAFLNLELSEHQLSLLLWEAVDGGQKASGQQFFSSRSAFIDWQIENAIGTALRIAQLDDLEEDEAMTRLEKMVETGDTSNPVFSLVAAVGEDIAAYFNRLYEKQQKKIRPQSPVTVPDHE